MRRWHLVPLASLATLAVGLATADVAVASGTLSVDRNTGSPGDPFAVIGGGFAPLEGVQVFWDPGQPTQAQLGAQQADSRGAFTLPTTVPQGASAGPHQIAALGQRTGPTPPQSFTVAPAAASSTPAVTPSPTATAAPTTAAPATAAPLQATSPTGGMTGSSGFPLWLLILLIALGIGIVGGAVAYHFDLLPPPCMRRRRTFLGVDLDDDDWDNRSQGALHQDLAPRLAGLVTAKVGTSPGNCTPLQIGSTMSDPNDYVYCQNVDCTGVCHVFWMPRRKPRGKQWPDWEDTGHGTSKKDAVIKEPDKVYICSCV